MIDKKLLLDITAIPSPSGYEGGLFKEITTYAQKYMTEFIPQMVSNELYLIKKSKKSNCKNIMIDAHSDQVSLRIYKITSDGFLYARAFGIDRNDIYGKCVTILNRGEQIKGVISVVPPHINDKIENNLIIIDIFVSSKSEAEKLVEIGNPAIINCNPPEILRNHIIGSGLDNAVSVYACLQMARNLDKVPINNNIIIHFSRREETGGLKYINMLRDVEYIPNKIDNILVVDTEIATDIPNLQDDRLSNIELGKGTVISRNMVDDIEMSRICTEILNTNNVKYQLVMSSIPGAGNNLASYNSINAIGLSVGIPLRNMHSGVETVRLCDIKNTINVLETIVQNL